MSVRVEFHFDFGSPNAYLSHRVIPAIEARTGVRFDYVPVLIGGVFKATNNVSPVVSLAGIKNKAEYQTLETQRFVRHHSITDYAHNPFFPVNTLTIMRGAVHCFQQGQFNRYVDEVFRHMWAQPKKMDDMDVIKQALCESGLPADEILTATQSPQVKKQLIDNTNDSVERGNFGSPTFFVDGEMYFGKDKLRDVEDEIMRRS